MHRQCISQIQSTGYTNSQDSYMHKQNELFHACTFEQTTKNRRRTLSSQREEKQFLEIPTFQCVSTAKLKQTGLTEPGGITHFRVISPFTLVVLQERKRLWFRTRMTLLDCFISITGGATGTERQNSVDKKWTLKQKVLIPAVTSQEPCIKEVCITWNYCQVVFLWADPFCLEHSCAHIAIFECLLYVWDDDALLQACRELKIRGKWSSRTRFQAQIAQTWIGCQTRDESSASLTDKKVGHHWFSEGIQRICKKNKKQKQVFSGSWSRASYWDLQVLLLFYVQFLAQYDGL